MVPRGGKRKGAGAPKGNTNAFKHGGRAKVIYGVPLDRKLTRFEYRALCMEQMHQLKLADEWDYGTAETMQNYRNHKLRYRGAIEFNERKNATRQSRSLKAFIRCVDNALKRF